MEVDPKNIDVLQLLRKLKDTHGTYPQELLAVRRQGYLKQVTEVAGGAGLAIGLRNTVRNARGASGLPPAAGILLEGLLVLAIVVEASALAYFHRDQITDYFRSFTNQPKVEEVSGPPVVVNSQTPGIQMTPSPRALFAPLLTGTATETATPVLTVTLQLAGQPTNPSTGQGSVSGGGQAVSTSAPSDGGSGNGNNGNHYGSQAGGGVQDTQTNPGRNRKNR